MMKFNQQSFTINASDMNLQSLKDISFIIGVGTTESINNELSFYYFKIQPQFKNVNIVRLTPGKEELCFSNHSSPYCYYVIDYNSNEIIDNLAFIVYVETAPTNELPLYIRYVDKSELDKLEFNEGISSLLPSEDKFDNKGTNSIILEEELLINLDYYCIIRVDTKYSQLIKAMISANYQLENPFLSNENRMYLISNKKTIKPAHNIDIQKKGTFQITPNNKSLNVSLNTDTSIKVSNTVYINGDINTLSNLAFSYTGASFNSFIAKFYQNENNIPLYLNKENNTIMNIGDIFPFSITYPLNDYKFNYKFTFRLNTFKYKEKANDDTFEMNAILFQMNS